MSDKETLLKNIVELTENGRFSIKQIDFDEKSFGNFVSNLLLKKKSISVLLEIKGLFGAKQEEMANGISSKMYTD